MQGNSLVVSMKTRECHHGPDCDCKDDPAGHDTCACCGMPGRRTWHLERDDYSTISKGRQAMNGDGCYRYSRLPSGGSGDK